MSNPTLRDWHRHMTTYGGVAWLLVAQTIMLIAVALLVNVCHHYVIRRKD